MVYTYYYNTRYEYNNNTINVLRNGGWLLYAYECTFVQYNILYNNNTGKKVEKKNHHAAEPSTD